MEFALILEQSFACPSKFNRSVHCKWNGEYRPGGNYRTINSVTIPDRYSEPHLQDCIHVSNFKRMFKKIYLGRAYQQIAVDAGPHS